MLFGPGDLRVVDLPEPEVGDHEVKVRVIACGICGSDLQLFRGRGGAHPATGGPIVLGHEVCGEIVDTGAGVDGVEVGTSVAIDPSLPCGRCYDCQHGQGNICRYVAFIGTDARHQGGLAEYVVAPAANIHRLAAGTEPTRGALVEPLTVAHHAIGRARVEPGAQVAVVGAGPIGIGLIGLLLDRGVGQLFVVEPSPHRRRQLSDLDTVVAIDPSATDAVRGVRSLTAGRGVDVSFDAAGTAQAIQAAQKMTARGGTIVAVALHDPDPPIDVNRLIFTEQVLTGAIAYSPGEFADMTRGIGQHGSMLASSAHTISLDAVVEEGFRALELQQRMKVLVTP